MAIACVGGNEMWGNVGCDGVVVVGGGGVRGGWSPVGKGTRD